jgi:hypothetical protein
MRAIAGAILCGLLFAYAGSAHSKEKDDIWGACPKGDRARIVKISEGKSPNSIILTVRYEQGKQEESLPEYPKGVNNSSPKIGGAFCMADDTE